jgi:hypothetical protein
MAKKDDETIEIDMSPDETRRLLESEDEKSKDLNKYAGNLPEPLKGRAQKIYNRLKKVYTGQVALDEWYGGFALSINPERDIEGWEWIAHEYEKRKKKSLLRSRIFQNVLAESKQKWQTGGAKETAIKIKQHQERGLSVSQLS